MEQELRRAVSCLVASYDPSAAVFLERFQAAPEAWGTCLGLLAAAGASAGPVASDEAGLALFCAQTLRSKASFLLGWFAGS